MSRIAANDSARSRSGLPYRFLLDFVRFALAFMDATCYLLPTHLQLVVSVGVPCRDNGRGPACRAVAPQGRKREQEIMQEQERWLSVEEIAAHLGVNRDTIYKWIDRRQMPAHKLGKLWKFKATEIDEWIRQGKAGTEGQENE